VQLIEERHGIKIDLDDPDQMPVLRDPYDVDPKVMEIFTKGMTIGIWQFTGRGITNLLKQIKPDWMGDLIATNALYRPGAMGEGSTWDYADLKQMPEDEIVYWDESIRFALAETFGIVAYQEQVMEICKTLGGFTPGQADDMRKAMGKLYRLPGRAAQEYMAQFKDQWDQGFKERDLGQALAEEIWKHMLSFGGYGFNKSHAGSYALQAYRDGWLKAYYPPEFYCSLLHNPPSTLTKNAKKKSEFIRATFREAEILDVTVAPPDINVSDRFFTLDGDVLRFGLESINDVGAASAGHIISKRPFENWEDFTRRVTPQEANSKVRDALMQSGACDSWGMRDELSGKEITKLEKERLGIPVTMTGEIQQNEALIRHHIYEVEEFESLGDKEEVIVGGEVLSISETKVKKGKTAGQEMAFVEIGLGLNMWRCTFFPELWARHKALLESGEPVMLVGRKDTYKGQTQVITQDCISLTTWLANIEKEEQETTA
jgi:DNA polymerase III alpha subunit